MTVREDVTLVKMSLNSDQSAFGELIDRYKNLVYGLLLSRIRDFDQVEYLAQDTFIEAYVNLGKIRKPASFSNWLCGIATNLCNRWLERQRRESEVVGQLTPFGEEAEGVLTIQNATVPRTPEEEYELQEMKEAIWKAIGELPEKSREAILLFYFNDMSHREISEFLGVAPSTVLSNLQNGREKLESKMIPFVEGTVKEKALGRKFKEKVMSALPLISFPDQKPVAPLLKWGLSLKGILTGIGALALIGGVTGWLTSSQEESQPSEEEFSTPRMMQTRLASPQEKALLASNLDEDMSFSEPGVATYPLKWHNEPLLKTEISAMFNSLGVDVKRYAYEIPDFHYICLLYESYVDGQKQESSDPDSKAMKQAVTVLGTRGGKNILTLILRKTDDMLHIWHASKDGWAGLGRFNVEGYYQNGEVRYGESLAVGKKSLVHAWVADSASSIEGYSERGPLSPARPVEEIASEWGLVIAIYAELGCKSADRATRRMNINKEQINTKTKTLNEREHEYQI